jgi:hypothetical protein
LQAFWYGAAPVGVNSTSMFQEVLQHYTQQVLLTQWPALCEQVVSV